MHKKRRNSKDDSTWQAVYMDLITMVMVLFMILWAIQQGGDGAPVDTDKVVPFSKLTLKDSAFPDGGTRFGVAERKELITFLTQNEKDNFLKLGYSEKEDNFYYITVNGHASLTGSFEQNMNVALKRAESVSQTIKDVYNKLGNKNFPNRDKTKNDRYMISVCGHSHNFPKQPLQKNLSGRALSKQQEVNRRVEVMYHRVSGKMMSEFYLDE
jgi:outer membrane protein OmpA-like peptidoglycan-associated protein